MHSLVFVIYFITLASVCLGYQLSPSTLGLSPKLTAQSSLQSVQAMKPLDITATKSLMFTLIATPTIALAAESGDKSAFLIPLVISVLTIFPFLYYAQALKPKERTVKQIELDSKTLKPVSKKEASTGKTTEARATKK